jgi:hypothetical protein
MGEIDAMLGLRKESEALWCGSGEKSPRVA